MGKQQTSELSTEHSLPSLHCHLLRVLRQASKVLEPPFTYRGEDSYLDLFGATLAEPQRGGLIRVAIAWVEEVCRRTGTAPDALLTPRTGNILLANSVAAGLGVGAALAVAKDTEAGSSAIEESDGLVCAVNFEGLTEFVNSHASPHRKLRVIGFDDSCREGSSLRTAVDRLNHLVLTKPAEFPTEPVQDCVVLFRRESTGDDSFAAHVKLHALLTLSNDDIRMLHRMDPAAPAGDYDGLAGQLLAANVGARSLTLSRQLYDETHA